MAVMSSSASYSYSIWLYAAAFITSVQYIDEASIQTWPLLDA